MTKISIHPQPHTRRSHIWLCAIYFCCAQYCLVHTGHYYVCIDSLKPKQICIKTHPNRSNMQFSSSLPSFYNIALFGQYSPLLCLHWFSDAQIAVHYYTHSNPNPNPNRSSMWFLSSLPLLCNIALFGPYSPLLSGVEIRQALRPNALKIRWGPTKW